MAGLPHIRDRHLMRAPEAFGPQAVHLFGPGPAFRRPEDDHRPDRPRAALALSCGALDFRDLLEDAVEGRREKLVHCLRLVALDEIRTITVADEERLQLVRRNAREDRRVGDLVAVE